MLLTHGDSIEKVAEGFSACATSTSTGLIAAIGKKLPTILSPSTISRKHFVLANKQKHFYGVQFHPEVDLTDNGREMIKNFLIDVCGVKNNYDIGDRQQKCIEYIK